MRNGGAALLLIMRRTTPFEPFEPIEPAEPLSRAIKGGNATRADPEFYFSSQNPFRSAFFPYFS